MLQRIEKREKFSDFLLIKTIRECHDNKNFKDHRKSNDFH